MSIVTTIESLVGGFSLAAVKEIAHKAAHAVLDAVDAKAEGEVGTLLIAEAAKIGVTLTPDQAKALVQVVVKVTRDHV